MIRASKTKSYESALLKNYDSYKIISILEKIKISKTLKDDIEITKNAEAIFC